MARRAHRRTPQRTERPALAPWLALAGAAHLAIWLALAAWPPASRRAPTGAPPGAPDPIWLDVVSDPAPSLAAQEGMEASSKPASRPSSVDAPQTAKPISVLERAPRAASATVPGSVATAPAQPAPSAAPPSVPAAEAVASLSNASGALDGPAAPGEVESGAAEPRAEGAPGAGQQLSLRDLGIDPGSNPFIGSASELPTERQILNQRLRQSLRGEIAKQDQARGLGPEGPAVRALTDIVMASASTPNTRALLRVRTDGAGTVTLVDVLEADRDPDEWQRIARELVRALAGKKLRVPAGSDGVSFQLRVVSRVQLPSGADPGLGIDVLGIPLKKGDGERSTKLSILSPVIKEMEVPDSDGLRVPVVAFSLIGGMGDLADIGAVARRLVTAYLVSMETHYPPANVAPAAPPSAAHPAAAP